MKWNSDHVSVLLKRQDAVALLPNVKPRKAKWLLDDIQSHFLNEQMTAIYSGKIDLKPYEINGLTITEHDYRVMDVTSDDGRGDDIYYITPEGAALLVKMYHAGCFELKGKPGSTEELEKYAASGEELLAAYAAKAELVARKIAQQERWKEHPEELPEGQFTPSLLNAIMWHHGVKGMHVSMEIGGITVTRRVSRHKSNSGKTSDNTVVFTWTSCDGNPRELTLKKSAYEKNRRNDADRNWGLPE